MGGRKRKNDGFFLERTPSLGRGGFSKENNKTSQRIKLTRTEQRSANLQRRSEIFFFFFFLMKTPPLPPPKHIKSTKMQPPPKTPSKTPPRDRHTLPPPVATLRTFFPTPSPRSTYPSFPYLNPFFCALPPPAFFTFLSSQHAVISCIHQLPHSPSKHTIQTLTQACSRAGAKNVQAESQGKKKT